MAHSSPERNEVHYCQLTFINARLIFNPPSSHFSPVNADMRCDKIQFGWQERERKGRTAWHNNSKPSSSFWKQGQCLAGIHVCFIITDKESQLEPTVTGTPYTCHFIKHPGSYSMPSSLPHILLSLNFLNLATLGTNTQ